MEGNAFPGHRWRPVDQGILLAFFLLPITLQVNANFFDSHAEVSMLPVTHVYHHIWKKGLPLRAANGSVISTFGKHTLSIFFSLRISFNWIFILADFGQPIISVVLFHEQELVIDMKHFRLLNTETL